MSIGEKLKSAREQNKLSVADIARRSYIQPKFIQAIDDNNLEFIPASHRKHFIKEYAKLVGLNLNEVLEELGIQSKQVLSFTKVDLPIVESNNLKAPSYSFSSFAQKSESESLNPKDKNKNLSYYTNTQSAFDTSIIKNVISIVVVLLLIGTGIYYFYFKVDDTSVAQKGLQSMTKDNQFADSPSDVSPRFDDDSLSAILSAQIKDSLRLDGHAVAQVWYSVLLDGSRTETGVIDSGQTKTWRAEKNFRVSLGNAGNLQLYLNEKPLGVLGPKQSAVKSQLIDSIGVHRVTAIITKKSSVVTTKSKKPKPSLMKVITPTEVRPSTSGNP